MNIMVTHHTTARGQLVCIVVGTGVMEVVSFPIYAPPPTHPTPRII
jgi:hypothetical protein